MKNSKLYSSVRESIEEGRLKEAVQLIEELRSSKDAETATRIEGAVVTADLPMNRDKIIFKEGTG